MRLILFKSIFILSLLITYSKAEIVNKVSISGNERVSEETIKLYGKIDLGKDYSENDLNTVLKNLYETNFFEDVKISLTNNLLKIELKEFPIINQLVIVGEKSKRYRDQIKKIISLKEKNSFIKSSLANDVEMIKSLYSELGYNSAKVETKLKKIDNKNFDLLIQIERGKQTKISSIDFTGNKSVRKNRLRDVVASEEDAFWKILTKNTNLNENLINLDVRLLKLLQILQKLIKMVTRY